MLRKGEIDQEETYIGQQWDPDRPPAVHQRSIVAAAVYDDGHTPGEKYPEVQ